MPRGMPECGRIAYRGRRGGIGHADDDVGLHRIFFRQTGAHGAAGVVQQAVVDDAVGTGKIDILEDAHGMLVGGFLVAG